MLKLIQIKVICIYNYTTKETRFKGVDAIVLKKMQFRPCIDIHNGKVKQIVGSSLKDLGNQAQENFVSEQDAAFYANMYKEDNVKGGHIILLNASDSEYFESTKEQALLALHTYPKGLQVGGGITAENASFYIENGASHVIVTSYVFKDGQINYGNLRKMVEVVGKNRIVLDLSCRYIEKNDRMKEIDGVKESGYYVVTDRWQKVTNEKITHEFLDELSEYCDEFLIHAVDVEGMQSGVELDLIKLLGAWRKIPMTYAGGIHTFDDIELVKEWGKGKINVTIGSALDLFGGTLKYKDVLKTIGEDDDKADLCMYEEKRQKKSRV